MKITKKIAERITLRDDATETGGISYIGETLDNFMAEAGVPFGSSLKRVNEALVECGISRITEQEYEKAKNIKEEFVLVPKKDMDVITACVDCILDNYKDPPYRKNWQEIRRWLHSGKFKIIKK